MGQPVLLVWTRRAQTGSVVADCVEEQYLFGRDSRCSYVLDDPENKGSRKFQIYSKKHFRIYRVSCFLSEPKSRA